MTKEEFLKYKTKDINENEDKIAWCVNWLFGECETVDDCLKKAKEMYSDCSAIDSKIVNILYATDDIDQILAWQSIAFNEYDQSISKSDDFYFAAYDGCYWEYKRIAEKVACAVAGVEYE